MFFYVFGALFLMCSVQSAIACVCTRTDDLLADIDWSKNIILTKMVSVERVRERSGEGYVEFVSAKMLVEKVFKGDLKVGDIVTFGSSHDSCTISYSEAGIGSRVLYYVHSPIKDERYFPASNAGKESADVYFAYACSRMAEPEYAAADINYLSNIDKLRGKTRVTVRMTAPHVSDVNFADKKIKITGENKSYKVKTDKFGFFELYDLPPGRYSFEAPIPFGWQTGLYTTNGALDLSSLQRTIDGAKSKTVTFQIEAGKHLEVSIPVEIDTGISGRVVSPQGLPLEGVIVEAIPMDPSSKVESWESSPRAYMTTTYKAGQFHLGQMPVGSYVLILNKAGYTSGEMPFGTIYYPGVTDVKNAVVIKVEAGNRSRNIDVQIPKMLDTIEVAGQLTYSDGNPVAGGHIYFLPGDKEREYSQAATTDGSGSFSLRLLKGEFGEISAYVYSSSLSSEDCTSAKAAIQDAGLSTGQIWTRKQQIFGDRDQTDVKLVIPFQSCAKP